MTAFKIYFRLKTIRRLAKYCTPGERGGEPKGRARYGSMRSTSSYRRAAENLMETGDHRPQTKDRGILARMPWKEETWQKEHGQDGGSLAEVQKPSR